MAGTASDAALPAPGPRALFLAFLAVGLSGFGGVLPFARRELVDKRAWLDAETFTETLALCQSLPGPNVINLSIAVGSRFAGVPGAIAAIAGLVGAPVVIVIGIGALYGRFGAVPRLQGAIVGLGAAAAGLVAATAARMAWPLVKRRPVSAAAFMALAFAAVGLMRLPLPWVLLVLAPAGVAAAWRRP
jgi:chromate transporter